MDPDKVKDTGKPKNDNPSANDAPSSPIPEETANVSSSTYRAEALSHKIRKDILPKVFGADFQIGDPESTAHATAAAMQYLEQSSTREAQLTEIMTSMEQAQAKLNILEAEAEALERQSSPTSHKTAASVHREIVDGIDEYLSNNPEAITHLQQSETIQNAQAKYQQGRIERLEQQVGELRKEKEELRAEVKQLQEETEKLQVETKEIRMGNEELKADIAKLRAETQEFQTEVKTTGLNWNVAGYAEAPERYEKVWATINRISHNAKIREIPTKDHLSNVFGLGEIKDEHTTIPVAIQDLLVKSEDEITFEHLHKVETIADMMEKTQSLTDRRLAHAGFIQYLKQNETSTSLSLTASLLVLKCALIILRWCDNQAQTVLDLTWLKTAAFDQSPMVTALSTLLQAVLDGNAVQSLADIISTQNPVNRATFDGITMIAQPNDDFVLLKDSVTIYARSHQVVLLSKCPPVTLDRTYKLSFIDCPVIGSVDTKELTVLELLDLLGDSGVLDSRMMQLHSYVRDT